MMTINELKVKYFSVLLAVNSLVPLLQDGNRTSLLRATKGFTLNLCEYLSMQECFVYQTSKDSSLVNQVRKETIEIENCLEDLYDIHITEPGGVYRQVMKRLLEIVTNKLEKDSKIFEEITVNNAGIKIEQEMNRFIRVA